jgi:phage gp36-like protein
MYSDVEQVRAILVGARTESQSLGANTLDTDQIEDEIKNADSQIDTALQRRYGALLPFSPVPPVINSISADIATYLCDLRFRRSREYGTESHPTILRYDRARRLLDDIGNGRRVISGLSTDNASEVFNPYEGTLMTTKQIFTRWPEGVINDG